MNGCSRSGEEVDLKRRSLDLFTEPVDVKVIDVLLRRVEANLVLSLLELSYIHLNLPCFLTQIDHCSERYLGWYRCVVTNPDNGAKLTREIRLIGK